MNLQRFCVKLFAQPSSGFDDESFIHVFHDWIRQRIDGLGTLIDVADYRHVPNGPGVMLITHEGNFAMDRTEDDRPGLLYQRKTEQVGDTPERILNGIRHALTACRLLVQDARVGGRIEFTGGEVRFIANDRLLAPNTDEAFDELVPDLRQVGTSLYGDHQLQRVDNDPRDRLAARLTGAVPVTIESLLMKVQSSV